MHATLAGLKPCVKSLYKLVILSTVNLCMFAFHVICIHYIFRRKEIGVHIYMYVIHVQHVLYFRIVRWTTLYLELV